MNISGKKVAITGGTGGIGSHLVDLVKVHGGIPIVIGRKKPEQQGDFIQGNLSTLAGVATVADELAARKPDVLVNLAGVQYFGFFQNQSAEYIAELYQINLIAPALLAQAVIPAMRARGSGQIVNIGSVFGAIPFAHFVTYSSAKAGLKALSQGLRRELKGTGIAVTHIAPRAVKTPFNDARIEAFSARSKVQVDDPLHVAGRILQAITEDRKELVIGFPESFFVHVNALLPGAVDNALAKNDLIAREILST